MLIIQSLNISKYNRFYQQIYDDGIYGYLYNKIFFLYQTVLHTPTESVRLHLFSQKVLKVQLCLFTPQW